ANSQSAGQCAQDDTGSDGARGASGRGPAVGEGRCAGPEERCGLRTERRQDRTGEGWCREVSSVEVKTPTGTTAETVELPGDVFDVQANVPLMHQVVTAQLAAARQGTQDTKTRGEVSGGGKKPYRQKGTGRARQGSERSPQFVGGGTVHGPTPRDYTQRTPKKMKAAALRGALSDRARSGQVHLTTAVVEGEKPSTKEAKRALAAVTGRSVVDDERAEKVLVVVERSDELTWRSARNVTYAHLIT